MIDAIEKLNLPQPVLLAGAAVVSLVVLLLLVGIARRLRGRRRAPAAAEEDLSIDVAALPSAGPARGAARLELYNLPVHLAVIVVAPPGRGGALPDDEQLPDLLEQIAPGMQRVLESHRPLVRRWPPQLSSDGFIHTFFGVAPLPGRRGKGSPWAALAGRCEWEEKNYHVGMIVCAAVPNSLGQIVVKHETGWLDLLRVRG